MAANACSIHELVITTPMALLVRTLIPRAAKFFLVALLGLPLCFLLSHLAVRRLPCARRVLG